MPMAARSQQRMTCSLLRSPLRGYDSNGAKSNAKGRRLVSLAVSVPGPVCRSRYQTTGRSAALV